MTEQEIYSALNTIFADIFFRDDIALTPELKADDVKGWDSFKHVEILLSVEETFDFTFSSREVDSFRCVGDLVRLIASKVPVGK